MAYDSLSVYAEKQSSFNLAEFFPLSLRHFLSSSLVSSSFIAVAPCFRSPFMPPLFRVVAALHRTPTAKLWVNVGQRVFLNGSGHSAIVVIS